jgi:hypothetical protein
MDGPRKRVNTYGKAGRGALVHDLLDVASQPSSMYTTLRESLIESLAPSRGNTPVSQLSEDPDVSRELNNELSTTWNFNKPRLRSPARRTTSLQSKVPASIFEFESFEEEPANKMKPLSKTYERRKIKPTGSDVDTRDHRGRTRQPVAKGDPNAHGQQTIRGTLDRTVAQKAARSGSNEVKVRTRTTKGASGSSSARHSPKKSTSIKPLTLSRPSAPPRRTPRTLAHLLQTYLSLRWSPHAALPSAKEKP